MAFSPLVPYFRSVLVFSMPSQDPKSTGEFARTVRAATGGTGGATAASPVDQECDNEFANVPLNIATSSSEKMSFATS